MSQKKIIKRRYNPKKVVISKLEVRKKLQKNFNMKFVIGCSLAALLMIIKRLMGWKFRTPVYFTVRGIWRGANIIPKFQMPLYHEEEVKPTRAQVKFMDRKQKEKEAAKNLIKEEAIFGRLAGKILIITHCDPFNGTDVSYITQVQSISGNLASTRT